MSIHPCRAPLRIGENFRLSPVSFSLFEDLRLLKSQLEIFDGSADLRM